MSCKICPNSNWVILPPLIKLIMTFESPSTIKLWKSNSFANQRAQHTTSTSTVSTEVGFGICYVKAAITNLSSLPIIIPRPVVYFFSKECPIKINFKQTCWWRTPSDWPHCAWDLGVDRTQTLLVFLKSFASHGTNLCQWNSVFLQSEFVSSHPDQWSRPCKQSKARPVLLCKPDNV